jgi:large subunit ribosomal protein L5
MAEKEETKTIQEDKPKRGRRASAKTPVKAKKQTARKSAAKSPRKVSQKGRSTKSKASVPPQVTGSQQPVNQLSRLQELHRGTVGPAMVEEFSYSSPMQIPTIEKIIVNVGLGEALTNARALEAATSDISKITGQRPITNRARKSIANYKLREGMPVGVSTTLRGRRMWEFFDRLVASALPRIRDFRGLSRKSFDGRGNYALGLREQVIFPEIDYNAVDRLRGLQVVITTTAPNDREGLRLLELLGVPFARTQEGNGA